MPIVTSFPGIHSLGPMGIAYDLANAVSVEDLRRCTEVGVEVLGPNTT